MFCEKLQNVFLRMTMGPWGTPEIMNDITFSIHEDRNSVTYEVFNLLNAHQKNTHTTAAALYGSNPMVQIEVV